MNNKYAYALVFDFDDTLCNKNLFFKIKKPNMIFHDHIIDNDGTKLYYENIFTDLQKIKKLLYFLKQNGFIICIASFGNNVIIEKILYFAFPNIFDLIITTDNYKYYAEKAQIKNIPHSINRLIIHNCDKLYGKNIIIESILKLYRINPQNLLYFDDDTNNINCVKKKYPMIKTYNNKKGKLTFKLIIDNLKLL